jgi:glycosyltransferase involved in cell wall biosynthesis
MGFEKRVRFYGYVTDEVATEILSTASFAIFPYRYITQSGALLTAVGHGLPYIATNLAAFVEFNRLHGGGVLVPVGDRDAMRDGVEKLWCDKSLGERLRRQIRATCNDLSWSEFSRELKSIYGTE